MIASVTSFFLRGIASVTSFVTEASTMAGSFTSFWMLQYFSYSQATTVVEIVIFTSSWRVQFFSYTWMINHFFFFFCVTNHDFFVETTADTNW